MDSSESARRDRRLLACVLGVALIARFACVALRGESLHEDRDGYRAIAERIVAGDGFADPRTGAATAYRPPLYPLLLAGLVACGGGAVALGVGQALLGTATAWLTWLVGRRLGLGRGAVGAAAIVAVEPLSIEYASHVMTETLATFLTVALLAIGLGRRRPFATGLAFGLLVLCRPSLWVFGGLLACVAVAADRRSWREWIGIVAGAALVVAPWTVRNVLAIGSPIVTTTHGGYTLLLGNNPVFFREVVQRPWGTVWERDSLLAWQASLDEEMNRQDPPVRTEVERDRWLRDQAKDWIVAHPKEFLRTCGMRLLWFWNVAPLGPAAESVPATVRGAVAAFESLLLLAAFAGVVRIGRDRSQRAHWRPLLLLVVSLTAVHAVYWSNARMRAPLVPAIALFAAAALCGRTGFDGPPEAAPPPSR